MTYDFILNRKDITSFLEDVEEPEPFYFSGRNIKLYGACGKFSSSSINHKITI